MKKMFGCGKHKEHERFPFDWLKPGEFTCDSTGHFNEEQKAQMQRLATERKEAGLPAIFWAKP